MVAVTAGEEFDHIVVGAGSAGCVIANRLTGDAGRTVLLVEAGGRDRSPLVRLPMLMGRLFNSGIYNWNYHTEPVPTLNGRSIFWPRGKVLGGSSTINGMIYVRGNRLDYDSWAQSGLRGWSYDDVLPAFRRSEAHVQRRDEFHGADGELTVCKARGSNPLFDTFIEAGSQAGYPMNPDFNGSAQSGFGRFDFTIRRGKRWSAASAFLRPAEDRPNLSLATDSLVRRIVIEGRRATGIEIERGGRRQFLRARKSVVLSAGAVNSPQILMLSGIGPGKELRKHGIDVLLELEGVGSNLQDHVDCVLAWECPKPVTLYRDLRADRLAMSVAEGMLFGTGIATTFPYEAGAFVESREGLAAPDLQLHFMPALEKSANLHFPNPFRRGPVEANHGFSIRVGPLIPESKGTISLRSKSPRDAPRIAPNYLSSKADIDRLISGIRIVRKVIGQRAFDAFRGQEMQPGPKLESEEDLTEWLRSSAMTTFHPVGTCRMGDGPAAVVDQRLKVHGVEGMRIADASVMPIITSGNTNAPTIMIGERVAEFIMEEE